LALPRDDAAREQAVVSLVVMLSAGGAVWSRWCCFPTPLVLSARLMDPALAVDVRTAADLRWLPKAAVFDEVVWFVRWWVWE